MAKTVQAQGVEYRRTDNHRQFLVGNYIIFTAFTANINKESKKQIKSLSYVMWYLIQNSRPFLDTKQITRFYNFFYH